MDVTVRELPALLESSAAAVLDAWVREQTSSASVRSDLMSEQELRRQSRDVLQAIGHALVEGAGADISSEAWADTRSLLTEISTTRAQRGYTPVETTTFVFSLKQPLFALLHEKLGDRPEVLATELWATTTLIDKLGLFTMETYQKSREAVIRRQQHELLELSTPVIKLWDGILAVPLIGTLDSARTQVVMETLLNEIVATGADLAIMDITGVPTVDTLVAQHILKTVSAARLMGAEVMISGIRPQIAQTMVHLGVDLKNVVTKATLADAIALALRSAGYTVSRTASPARN